MKFPKLVLPKTKKKRGYLFLVMLRAEDLGHN